jgi:hypothetical protein
MISLGFLLNLSTAVNCTRTAKEKNQAGYQAASKTYPNRIRDEASGRAQHKTIRVHLNSEKEQRHSMISEAPKSYERPRGVL